jgi:hypothetical protein
MRPRNAPNNGKDQRGCGIGVEDGSDDRGEALNRKSPPAGHCHIFAKVSGGSPTGRVGCSLVVPFWRLLLDSIEAAGGAHCRRSEGRVASESCRPTRPENSVRIGPQFCQCFVRIPVFGLRADGRLQVVVRRDSTQRETLCHFFPNSLRRIWFGQTGEILPIVPVQSFGRIEGLS